MAMTECPHDPRALLGKPIGQYHCPDCGCMVLAGVAHVAHDEECEYEPKFKIDLADFGPPEDGPRADPPSVTCPRCGRRSHNPGDVANGYCGFCHDWTSHGDSP